MKAHDLADGPHDGKKVFRQLGTCSRTFFHILNREFGHPKTLEERAADTLSGGIMRKGHQCGMLWGASLAIGAEAYRTAANEDQAKRIAVKATQKVLKSFRRKAGTINCRAITGCDFSSTWSFFKYMISGRFLHCFDLAQEWAPDAVKAATEGLTREPMNMSSSCSNCASEVAKKMGATDEQMIVVSGFAGGLGLSGAACGALSAAIWLKSVNWCREESKKSPMKSQEVKEVLDRFDKTTGAKIHCTEITGRHFRSLEEHSRFIRAGGCEQLIDALAKT